MANSMTVFAGDVIVQGSFSPATLNVPALSVRNASIGAGAAGDYIMRTKLEGTNYIVHSQTGTVANTTQYLRAVYGATGTILAMQACVTETIATGADRTITLDLLKSTGAGAFASILTTALVLTNASVLRTLTTASILTPGLVVGDLLKLTAVVAGGAGNQALGLIVSIMLREDPA